MRLPPGLRASVPGMAGAVIDHTQQRGCKCLGQHGFEPCGAGLHCRHIGRSPDSAKSQLPTQREAAHNGTMSRRVPRTKAYAPDPAAPGRTCDSPGCEALGEYRAPKSRRDLKNYWWFCLEHVRAYNSTWDYYKGMSQPRPGAAGSGA